MEENHDHANGPHLNKVFPKHDSQEDSEVDIVAVHGLDTSSPKTWLAYEKDGPPNVRGRVFNWLSDDDMLPTIVPKARIWTFDYNANYHSNASVVDLLALGETLLRSLSEIRSNALESAGSFKSGFEIVLRATTSVVFLGAPLRGTRAASSAQWRILLAGIRGHEVSDTLITDLNQNSTVLRNLIQGFSAKAIKGELQLSITCFYETRKTEVLNAVLPRSVTQFFPNFIQEILVSQESACIDGHDQIPLDARHAMMNKYRGPNDRNFLLVSNRIKKYVLGSPTKLALRASYHRNQTGEPNFWQPSQQEINCHQSLRTSDYESHKERNPDRVEGTCRWFLEHSHFQYWWKSKTSKLLWVSADPGCGKSVLAKSLVDKELKSTKFHTTCYFFFRDDNVEQASATNALCALLHQLFDQRKPLIKHALSDFRSNGVHLAMLFERLWCILKEAGADAETGTVVCIIDGLDECEESGRTKLLSYLDYFYSDTTSNDRRKMVVKFLITSRPYFHIERNLHGLISKYPVIRLAGEAETVSISREINLVIKVQVQRLGETLKLDDSVRLILEEELLKFKNRTYLWLHLILEVLRQRLETVS
ncbi:hypothetical protein MMC30_008495 [Trapelia coarctata]|nr:hypothetical protein [Trapelia coarctata]